MADKFTVHRGCLTVWATGEDGDRRIRLSLDADAAAECLSHMKAWEQDRLAREAAERIEPGRSLKRLESIGAWRMHKAGLPMVAICSRYRCSEAAVRAALIRVNSGRYGDVS